MVGHNTAGRLFLGFTHFLEHAATVFVGLVMIIIGLGLGVTMIMLPVGVVVGLLGVRWLSGGCSPESTSAD